MLELLAELCHEQWANWTRYLLDSGKEQEDGSVLLPAAVVERADRQVAASYADLSEAEKDSDRRCARGFTAILNREIRRMYGPGQANTKG